MKKVKLTILHSNDMHGDFLAEMRAGESRLTGGLALLSGYINKVRHEEENVIYVISGDMVQGSIIDTEYKGISTVEIMNYRAPDVVTLGNLVADALAESTGSDVVLMGVGAIRSKELGPLVTLGNFVSCFPFEETLTRFTINGQQLWHIFNYWMRPENRDGEGKCYQVNGGVSAVYSESERKLISLKVKGEPVAEDGKYTVALTGYHLRSSEAFLGISLAELSELRGSKVVATSIRDVVEEYLRNKQNMARKVEGRLVYQQ